MDEINYSEEAALQAAQLSKATDPIDKYITLQDGTLRINYPYIFINGEIEGYDGKTGDTGLVLTVVDKNVSQQVPCMIQNKNGNNYQFRCTPEKDVTGSIFLQTIKDNDTAITLNMTQGNENVNFKYNNTEGNTDRDRGVAIYRKSSSGLSGGAIAGIVIACAVALIIASIAAIMLKKSSVAAPFQPQNPSIVGLRSIENYSQQSNN